MASLYQLEVFPSDIVPSIRLRFLAVARESPLHPLCITEGAKAGALLTAGYAAIALPGVNGGYQCNRMNLETASVVSPHSPVIETPYLPSPTKTPTNHHQE